MSTKNDINTLVFLIIVITLAIGGYFFYGRYLNDEPDSKETITSIDKHMKTIYLKEDYNKYFIDANKIEFERKTLALDFLNGDNKDWSLEIEDNNIFFTDSSDNNKVIIDSIEGNVLYFVLLNRPNDLIDIAVLTEDGKVYYRIDKVDYYDDLKNNLNNFVLINSDEQISDIAVLGGIDGENIIILLTKENDIKKLKYENNNMIIGDNIEQSLDYIYSFNLTNDYSIVVHNNKKLSFIFDEGEFSNIITLTDKNNNDIIVQNLFYYVENGRTHINIISNRNKFCTVSFNNNADLLSQFMCDSVTESPVFKINYRKLENKVPDLYLNDTDYHYSFEGKTNYIELVFENDEEKTFEYEKIYLFNIEEY